MHAQAVKTRYRIFNRPDVVATGWYWLLPSRDLKRGAVAGVKILGYDLAVFRGADGAVAALDAYCPHMGAHLSEGKVEGNQLRCFFHNWCFDRQGACTDIPCLNGNMQQEIMQQGIRTRSWTVAEQSGLIWIWLGADATGSRSPQSHPESHPQCPDAIPPIPSPPELAGCEYDYSLGNRFAKNCHPNVVMVNAIDEQHFRTVHNLPGEVLTMAPDAISPDHIEFRNQGRVPSRTLIGKLIGYFYKDRLTYTLDYWNGSTGTIVFGPDFLHLYLMFALRLNAEGNTEGYCIAFAKKNNGLFSLFNWLILWLTQVGAFYFASGDTRVFQTIRFQLTTPIAADRAVLAFIQHLDKQQIFPCA